MNPIAIIDYLPEHQPYFEQFNREWIERYFWLEDLDRYVLQHPEEAILSKGGCILMATYNGQVAGTVALKQNAQGVYEFTKMAVAEPFQRKGIAEALSHAALQRAQELGAREVILYSQTALVPAIALYRKLGFKEVPLEPGVYARADIKMAYPL